MKKSTAFALCAILTAAAGIPGAGAKAEAHHQAGGEKAPTCTDEAQCYRDYVKYFMKHAAVFKMMDASNVHVPPAILKAYNDAMAVAQMQEWATKPEKYPEGAAAIRTICPVNSEDIERFNYLKERLELSPYGKAEFETAVRGMSSIDRVFGVLGEKEKPCDYLMNRLNAGRTAPQKPEVKP